jgi:hypothetical protein
MSDSSDAFQSPEWTTREWQAAWSVYVGRVYRCEVCGSMIMCTKGGVGNLEPICCGKPMVEVKRPRPDERGY